MQTVEAIIDSNGMVRLLTDIRLPKDRRAIVTILDEEPKKEFDHEAAERKKKLFEAFRKFAEKDIFRKIDDPVEWQRKLRDEWER
jgi:hypothetical protein